MSDPAPMPGDFDRRTLLALLDASSAVAEQLDLPVVFDQVTRKAASVLNAEAASLLVMDDSEQELVFQTAIGPAAEKLRGKRMPADEGIAGQVIRTGRAVRIDDVRANSNFFSEIDAETTMHTRSMIAAPLAHRGRVLGVVEVLNPRGREEFSEEDVSLLQIFANLVAVGMHNAKTLHKASTENKLLKRSAPAQNIIGSSDELRAMLDLCHRVAGTNTTVLITGETGTGKEVAARLIHDRSPRNGQPFVAVNCAAISESLLESELFGHEKGAFTGADRERQGWFEIAEGGTLFLDEIGETNGAIQANLLRVLQEREFTRVGGTKAIRCDVRILAATNRNLKAETANGTFREDLYYRLNVFPVHLPALRERRGDVAELAAHFISELAPNLGLEPPPIDPDALEALSRYDWPGNIRELRNVIERCILLSDGQITRGLLPAEIHGSGPSGGVVERAESSIGVTSAEPSNVLEAQERRMIVDALTRTNWNQSEAARDLGVTRDFLRYRITKYGLQRPAPGG